jgi:hypothetical protein
MVNYYTFNIEHVEEVSLSLSFKQNAFSKSHIECVLYISRMERALAISCSMCSVCIHEEEDTCHMRRRIHAISCSMCSV